MKRTKGKRAKRPAGDAKRCVADIRARVVTGSKICVDLRSAVYRRCLISRYKEDLPSVLTACAINLIAQRAMLHANCAIVCDAIGQVVSDSSELMASYAINEGRPIERMDFSHFDVSIQKDTKIFI